MTPADIVVFQLPAPVKIGAPPELDGDDKRLDYSLADMLTHFGRHAPEYNSDMTGARAYKRTQDAFDAVSDGKVTMLAGDCVLLKRIAEKPRCGWIALHKDAAEPGPDGQLRKVRRRVHVPAVTFLPLVDAIPDVAP